MKTIPIIALTLAASLAQAEPMTEEDCRQSFVSSAAFSLATESTLDRCLAKDTTSCVVFVSVVKDADIIPKLTRSSACIDADMIDLDLLLRYHDVIDRMGGKVKRLAAVFGGER